MSSTPVGITRRGFVLGTGGAGASLVLRGQAAAKSRSSSTSVVFGPVIVSSPVDMHVRDASSGETWTVHAARGTTISRGTDGLLTNLAAFTAGDVVLAEGLASYGRVLAADYVGSAFYPTEGAVTSVNRKTGTLRTSRGRFRTDTLVSAPGRASADDLSKGTEFEGLYWESPSGERELVLAVLT